MYMPTHTFFVIASHIMGILDSGVRRSPFKIGAPIYNVCSFLFPMDLIMAAGLQTTDDLDTESWVGQIEFLAVADFSFEVRMVLTTMTARRLLETALVSTKHYALVAAFLDYLRNHDLEEETMSDDESDPMSNCESESMTDVDSDLEPAAPENTPCGYCVLSMRLYPTYVFVEDLAAGVVLTPPLGLDDIPAEICLCVLDNVRLPDRSRLAQASCRSGALVAEALQSVAAKILAAFGLRFADVRLMQTATGAIIVGSAVAALARPEYAFVPDDLDFIAGHDSSSLVEDFLHLVGGFCCVPMRDGARYRFVAGIRRVSTMTNSDGKTINVIEAVSGNPFDIVGHLHLSCVYGAWGADGLRHCYPSLTAAGTALTTPAKLSLRGSRQAHDNVWRIVQKYIGRGFTLALNEYDAPHTCGVDWSCPATLWTTDDGGCSFSPFPAWIYDRDAVEPGVTCWTLGGTGCRRGVFARDGKPVSFVVSMHDARWKSVIRGYINTPLPSSGVSV
ncbi:hypothetical protein B0H13DRAFT_1891528 [Mycena leptocephala]|nr:hypothetical protein B0H13DRAFT_1891528 [Mycena leptocephala]